MPTQVLYQVPMATAPVCLLTGTVCLLFVLAIFGWWLPRALRLLRTLPAGAQGIIAATIAVIPVAIGFAPLIILIALIRNPTVYITDSGVTQESVFHASPLSFSWEEIGRVHCRLGRDGLRMVQITVTATDGRRIELGNTGGVDFASIYELFQNRLGPEVVQRCQH
jgi:hypothetical protein